MSERNRHLSWDDSIQIITRHPVFHGVSFHLILQSIKEKRQKPEESYLRDLESSLESNPEYLNIFTPLKSIVTQCWGFNLESRPDVRQVDDAKTDPAPEQDKTKQHIMLSYNWTDSKAVTHRRPSPRYNKDFIVASRLQDTL
ncbi:unnamed protein product [Clavelina lepadiformis]|uniref:Uncharacterized protein n=1 Tax=Clavelina lepadiformis TaxID=159417 RepID=A0ABP0G7W5_CLALP